jgi:hypothetical protein
MSAGVTSLQFFGQLKWLDGSPLLDHVEPYRCEIFSKMLDSFDPDDRPLYNMGVFGRGKKNWKSADLVLAGLYCLVIRRSPLGNDGIIVASDEGQAADDLGLAKKLVAVNRDLHAEIETLAKELRLRDGTGSLRILPGRDVAGSHGKTYGFLGVDELHTWKDWSLLEALAPDPTRTDALTWITSYDTLFNTSGVPLYDLKQLGKAGSDPRMLFSWYSGGDLCTDPAFANLAPEERANPSLRSWPDGDKYIEQQRTRLPTGRFRRLHLNLPGAPEGAAFNQEKILACVVSGRRSLPPERGRRYFAGVDLSGGSNDDAVLAIAHLDDKVVVIDLVVKQAGGPPFNPRDAIRQFAAILSQYRISRVFGDAYAGTTFREDFRGFGITYEMRSSSASELYEALEPVLNAGEVELLDHPIAIEQLVCLVWRGNRITHEANSHDDHANAVALVVSAARGFGVQQISPYAMPVFVTSRRGSFGDNPRSGTGLSEYAGYTGTGVSTRNPAWGLPRDGRDSWER